MTTDEYRQLLNDATRGPWLTHDRCPPVGRRIIVEAHPSGQTVSLCNHGRSADQFTVPQDAAFANAALIAHSRTVADRLMDTEALESVVARFDPVLAEDLAQAIQRYLIEGEK